MTASSAQLRDEPNYLCRTPLRVPTQVDQFPPAQRGAKISILIRFLSNWTEMELPAVPLQPETNCRNAQIYAGDEHSLVACDNELRHDFWNIRMIEHATEQLLEPRLGQRAFDTPTMERTDQYTVPGWPGR